jgi:hypothetical protein
MSKKENKPKKKVTVIDYMHIAVPVAAALAVIFVAAGFIVYKSISLYKYNERWKDYDECGLS